MVAFVPILQGNCCLWKGQRDQWGVCAWHNLFWDGFNWLAAEMEQKAVSRCLQILIFILPKQEQITHTGRRTLLRRGVGVVKWAPCILCQHSCSSSCPQLLESLGAIHTWEVTENNVNSSISSKIVCWDSNQTERNPPWAAWAGNFVQIPALGQQLPKEAKNSLLVSSIFLSSKSPQQEELKQVCKFFAWMFPNMTSVFHSLPTAANFPAP